jgi:hypothetical protein
MTSRSGGLVSRPFENEQSRASQQAAAPPLLPGYGSWRGTLDQAKKTVEAAEGAGRLP